MALYPTVFPSWGFMGSRREGDQTTFALQRIPIWNARSWKHCSSRLKRYWTRVPLSENPNDFTSLTPGHFLMSTPLTAYPEPSLDEVPVNRLSRWQHIQLLRQHFWKRWIREYLHQCQERNKWQINEPSVHVGQMVTIKEDKHSSTIMASSKNSRHTSRQGYHSTRCNVLLTTVTSDRLLVSVYFQLKAKVQLWNWKFDVLYLLVHVLALLLYLHR